MSDGGEKTCPLCAEEMDLTDQQLKPCKCGYQVCVWCWHQIIDMAEKNETEGRCPACRNPYDKQKIVGMATNCRRLLSEVNMERKKTQKAKPKPSEVRKQLGSVRVIQRNLVYIVGLPLNLADEDSLQQKEYFGQYGKVLKVSMSRTAAGVVQQFPNNTCSVYITYTTEEEAIQCIQSVHGFVLDGRSLKACFGTTKYCHAWLRNMPCTNRECLYLHEIGSQEDSFTKDEIISAYTRSRVQQITGVTNNLQQRSGSMLPPPIDDRCNNSGSAKPIVTKASNSIAGVPQGSPPHGTSARSVTLPAAAPWGMRSSNQPIVQNSVCSNEPAKQKPGAFLSAVSNVTYTSASHSDELKKPTLEVNGRTLHAKTKPELPKPLKQHAPVECRTDFSEKPVSPDRLPTCNQLPCLSASASVDNDRASNMARNVSNSFDHTLKSCRSISSDGNTKVAEKIKSLCTNVPSMSIDKNVKSDPAGVTRHDNLHSDSPFIKSLGTEVLHQHCGADMELSALQMCGEAAVLANECCVSRSECDVRKDSQSQVVTRADSEIEEDILSFNSQRLQDPEITSRSVNMHRLANFLHVSNRMPSHTSQYSGDLDVVDSIFHSSIDSRGSDRALLSFEYAEKLDGGPAVSDASQEHAFLFPDKARSVKQIGPFLGNSQVNSTVDTTEDNIIANILSLDLDECSTSPQNLARLLGESDRETGSLKLSQSNNQSRFSFARQEELNNQAFESYSIFNQVPNGDHLYQDSLQNRGPYLDKLSGCNGVASGYFKGLDNFSTSPSVFSSNKLSTVSRTPVSAPPGFSIPSRSPPPGFSSNGRMEQTLNAPSRNRLVGSSLARNSYQAPSASVENIGDMELVDPAILAIGQGRLQNRLDSSGLDLSLNFPVRFNAENDGKFQQLLMQNPLSPLQNTRFPNIGDNNIPILGNSYGISSVSMNPSQGSSVSPFAQLSVQQHSRNPLMPNGHLDGWNNEVQPVSGLGMADLLGNESGGFNKFYGNHEGSTFGMTGSGSIYNGAYRI